MSKKIQIKRPADVAIGRGGNLYMTDYENDCIYRQMSDGQITILAGTEYHGFQDGTVTEARFNNPLGLALDSAGNLYVADHYNHQIRRITPKGEVSTLIVSGFTSYKDDTQTIAEFSFPCGIAVDFDGFVYVADTQNNCIRKITPVGVVITLAGSTKGFRNGTGTKAQFSSPYSIAVDSSKNVYVADTYNHQIRKITKGGVVSTLAGCSSVVHRDGTSTTAQFHTPRGITVDSAGNIYVADTFNHRIRKVTPNGVEVSTLAGNGSIGHRDGTSTTAQFNYPSGVTVDSEGNVYVADSFNHCIRKVTPNGM